MKKIISLILSTVMLLSTVITVNAASFKDVKSSDWYYSSVNYVADKGIMNGTSNTKFSPKASLTRAMGVTLLYRVAGSPSVAGVNIPFTDVKGGQWYTDAVKWAYSKGIVTGKSNTFFHTNGNITRAEFATILNRYSAFMKYTLPVKRSDTVADSGKIPEWAFMSVWTMYRAEIINGKSGGIFDPNAKITRAEAAAMIERFMKAPKDGSGNNTNTETQPPVQNDPVPTTGKLVIKDKKYDYNGANVVILNVENQTSKNLNVTIDAKYQDASGKTIKTETRVVEGFPANFKSYVILQPGIKFDKFSYEVKTSAYSGEALMKYISYVPTTVAKLVPLELKPEPDYGMYPKGEERARIEFKCIFTNSYGYDLKATRDLVFFDNKGEIYYIATYGTNARASEGHYYIGKNYYDTLYSDFSFPNNLAGELTYISGVVKVWK